jgi:hypothetical protein
VKRRALSRHTQQRQSLADRQHRDLDARVAVLESRGYRIEVYAIRSQ